MAVPPPRGEVSADPMVDAMLAACGELDAGSQFRFHELLGEQLALIAEPAGEQRKKELRATRALRAAAAALEKPPSEREYESFRQEQLAAGASKGEFPPERTIRAWLGQGSWNDALRKARLETVPDGDAVVRSLGAALTREECSAALRLAAESLGGVPGIQRYLAWSRSLEVRKLPGRRPRSQGPFDRLFGGYLNALREAGLIDDSGARNAPESTCVRAGKYFQTDGDCFEALHSVARTLGRSPRTAEYAYRRQLLIDESRAAGETKTMPALGTIQRRFGTWDTALVSAGLEPLGGRHTAPRASERVRHGRRYDDAEILDAICAAYDAIGEPFTARRYGAWRERELEKARRDRRFLRLPHYYAIWTHFGRWSKAATLALNRKEEL